ncbi:hypothetical protein K2173_004790 [Erythroxylum novogranatense]|uniref:Uncharacterized protein n=1 Tax=Erythroxylum novogranatense TaxID=1862640 RepID=A0AAV8SJW3_9ROSI|nr:hypothetical protein K2173_004790 [Erythroxylum novogranatense]
MIVMRSKSHSLLELYSVFLNYGRKLCLERNPVQVSRTFCSSAMSAICSTISQAQVQSGLQQAKDTAEVLKTWGCSEDDVQKLFSSRPSLRTADLAVLQSKLRTLESLGIRSSDLVRIICCRPRLFSCRINNCFNERIDFFMTMFGSRELLRKAIIRNPSLLTYDFHDRIKPVIAQYEALGISKGDLFSLILSRPTLIPRSSFNDEKMEYICKSGTSKDSKMYKYVVSIVGVSRIETIRRKVANIEKFGFSDHEIWSLFGRCPILLTMSVDRVQRNMTFVVAVMKLPAKVVLDYPFLLLSNLECVLKPRILLGKKIQDMQLFPQIIGPLMLRALRMTEERFCKVFVSCHPKGVAEDLMEFYKNAKKVRRLAEASKKCLHEGFPF